MDRSELKKALEAILFASGDAVQIKRLSRALDVSEKEISQAADELISDMDKESRALTVIRLDDAFQMCTKKEVYEYLLKFVAVPGESRLTDVQLEVLSIIAYKQPVTKLEIENIRGVNTDYVVNRLAELGLIEEKGRLEAVGRPYLFGTTQEFLRRFGLNSLDELPEIDNGKAERFRAEAENELGSSPDDPVNVDI